jgi:hypothetical protein
MARAQSFAVVLLTIASFVVGCGNPQAPVDRIGTNAVDYRGGHRGTFPADAALDIRRAYYDSTDEEQNIIEESDTDRPWYEREYMRVNWATSLLTVYYGQTKDLNAILALLER